MSDFPTFFDVEDEYDDDEAAVDVDGILLEPGITSDSSHMWERT